MSQPAATDETPKTPLGDLRTQLLAAATTDGALTIPVDRLPGGAGGFLAGALTGGLGLKSDVVLELDSVQAPTTLTVTGTLAAPWQLSAIPGGSLSDVGIKLIFTDPTVVPDKLEITSATVPLPAAKTTTATGRVGTEGLGLALGEVSVTDLVGTFANAGDISLPTELPVLTLTESTFAVLRKRELSTELWGMLAYQGTEVGVSFARFPVGGDPATTDTPVPATKPAATTNPTAGSPATATAAPTPAATQASRPQVSTAVGSTPTATTQTGAATKAATTKAGDKRKAAQATRAAKPATAVKSPAASTTTTYGTVVGLWCDGWPTSLGWKAGDGWPTLTKFTFRAAVLLLSSAAMTADQLEHLPVDDDFADAVAGLEAAGEGLSEGLTFAADTSISTTPLAELGEALGLTDLAVYAHRSRSGTRELRALATGAPSAGAISFTGLSFRWATATADSQVAVTAAGAVALESGTSLAFDLTGNLSSAGYGSLSLALAGVWKAPFGYSKLTIDGLRIALSVQAIGVEVTLAGAFSFTTKKGSTFALVVAAGLRNFAAPSAVVLSLAQTSVGKQLALSEVIEGVTTIDLTTDPTSEVAKAAHSVDSVLQIAELTVWAVAGTEPVTVGNRAFAPGFGFHGNITVLGRTLILFAEVNVSEKRFSGYAELPEVVTFGTVLTLGRPAAPKTPTNRTRAVRSLEPGKGPVLSVSSVINDTFPDYFNLAASVVLFDLVHADLYAKANDKGLVFSAGIKAGTADPKASSAAAWTEQIVTIVVQRDQLKFSARFGSTFGLRNITLGGFDLFGGLRVPVVAPLNFGVEAQLDVVGDAAAGTLTLSGALRFSYQDFDFQAIIDPNHPVSLKLADAPTKVAELGPQVLSWIRDHLAALIEAKLKDAKDFAVWARKHCVDAAVQVGKVLNDHFHKTADEAAKLMHSADFLADAVAKALKDAYHLGSAVAEQTLKVAGYGVDAVGSAMSSVYAWTDAILAAASLPVSAAYQKVEQFITEKPVAMVVFNQTANPLQVTAVYCDRGGTIWDDHARVAVADVKTSDQLRAKAATVPAGGTLEVGTFDASTGRWGYVYLTDTVTKINLQLYIEMGSVTGNRYATFQYVNPHPQKHNPDPVSIAKGYVEQGWSDTGRSVGYTLLKTPPAPPAK